MSEIPLRVASNAALIKDLVALKLKDEFVGKVKKPTFEQCEPRDLRGYTFTAKARAFINGKPQTLVVTLGVNVIDLEQGTIQLYSVDEHKPLLERHKPSEGKEVRWDVVGVKNGVPRQFWRGTLEVFHGVA